MSTINDIVNVERAAAERLNTARQEAETIKQAGQAGAEQIREAARKQRMEEEQAIKTEFEQRWKAEEEQMQVELEKELARRRKKYETHAAAIVDWVTERILRGAED